MVSRNSQVGLYQSGDVDYLIATDAIGMGLNMDINEIYFSNLKKLRRYHGIANPAWCHENPAMRTLP